MCLKSIDLINLYFHVIANLSIYSIFVDYRFVDSRFVYTLNTKTLYSRFTKHQTLKLNAKTGGLCPPEPPLNCLWLAVSNWWGAKIIDELVVDEPKTSQFIVQWIFLSLLSCPHYFFSDQRRRYSDRLWERMSYRYMVCWFPAGEGLCVSHDSCCSNSHPEPTQPTAPPPGPPQSTATPPGLQPLIPQPVNQPVELLSAHPPKPQPVVLPNLQVLLFNPQDLNLLFNYTRSTEDLNLWCNIQFYLQELSR